MRTPSKSIVACLVLGSFGFIAACSSDSSSDDDDKSDEGGGGGGGKGGNAGKGGGSGGKSGGSGGSANGGSAGAKSGGSGGSATGGSGGSGGSAMGGSGGSAMGGSGGSAMGGSGGQPPAISGDGVFFSGKDMTITKLVAGDAMPGYFYGSPNTNGVKIEEIPSDPALPVGTKYAVSTELNTAMPENFIFGWNWRADKPGDKWTYADISQYAGVSFWIKSDTSATAVGFTGVFMYNDDQQLVSGGFGGICEAEPCAPAVEYAAIIARKNWTKAEIRFSDNNGGVPKLTATSRIDLLQLRMGAGGPTAKVYITGMKLLKQAELAPL